MLGTKRKINNFLLHTRLFNYDFVVKVVLFNFFADYNEMRLVKIVFRLRVLFFDILSAGKRKYQSLHIYFVYLNKYILREVSTTLR